MLVLMTINFFMYFITENMKNYEKKSDTNLFKSSVLITIEDQEEYAELLNKLQNLSGP